MTAIRNHRIFTIYCNYEYKKPIYDTMGEKTGTEEDYSRKNETLRIVAPNELVAKAWVMDRRAIHHNVRIEGVESIPLNAFIQDHIY